ncbi:hypothetical protein V8D89_015916 [Ganoderma adspersum]
MADTAGADIDLTLGLIFMGFIATGCLFGVTTAQFGWYFVHYRQDRQVVKVLVLIVWLLDALHLGLYFTTMYIYLVEKKGLTFGQQPLPWSSNAQLLVNACVICIIQSFYASRIWQLSRRRLLLAIMFVLISTAWCNIPILRILYASVMTNTVAEYVLLAPYDIAMSVMSASTDTFLSGALIILLWTFRKDTQGADRLINKLLFFAVNTGLLTGSVTHAIPLLVLTEPSTNLFVLFYYIGTRLYTVSLLAMLNARIDLRIQAERMGERTLPEIEVTAPQRLTNKKSSQAIGLRKADVPDAVVTMPCHESDVTGTVTTAGESSSSAPTPVPPRVHYFIVTKKRKRSRLQAVDPCLGFYPVPSSSPRHTSHLSSSQPCLDLQMTTVSSFAEEMAHTSSPSLTHGALERSYLVDSVYPATAVTHTEAAANGVTLDRAPDLERVPRHIEATLTVEGFLRSAPTVKATKGYRNRRGGRNMKEVREIEWTSDDEEYVPEELPVAKKPQRRKKTRPLSARLLAAAVVTGVDVVGGLLFPDPSKAHTSTVRPLPLDLGGGAPSPIDIVKSRRRRFVDPRKVDRADSQFSRAAEDAPVRKAIQEKEQRPITAWEPDGHAVSSSSLGNGSSRLGEYFVARPLTLVSSTHPRSALRARCTTIISRSCPIPKRRKNETPRGERGGPLKSSMTDSIPNLPMAPNGPHTQRRASFGHNSSPHTSSALDAPFLPHRNTREGCDPSVIGDYSNITLCPAAKVPPAPVAIPSPSSPSRFTLDSNLDEVLPERDSERPKSTHKLEPLIAFPPRSAPLKPLKSLVSLMDDLREIARNATQISVASQARRSTRLRPASTSSSKEDRNPVRSASRSRSIRSRPLTARSVLAAHSARPASMFSRAQIDVAPTQDFDEGGDSHPTFPKDCGACDSSGSSADAHSDIRRVDVLAILESNQRKAILLPSSPLPGWNALPCSTIGARDSEDSDCGMMTIRTSCTCNRGNPLHLSDCNL